MVCVGFDMCTYTVDVPSETTSSTIISVHEFDNVCDNVNFGEPKKLMNLLHISSSNCGGLMEIHSSYLSGSTYVYASHGS